MSAVPQDRIRNFCIIAHIDHGKSTLADRILELTGVVSKRESREQYLDKMDLERERGITIKAQTVRIPYTAADGLEYELNLIDTPGHVDFNYEVSRSLAACEGALLVVDATQGVEAQTLANVYLALDNDHEIIPVLNKIDLPSANVDAVREEIEETIGLDCTDALEVSAKTGQGVGDVLEAIVRRLPPPDGDPDKPLKALIFDSWYDSYQGVVTLFRVVDGALRKGDKIRLMSTGKEYDVLRLGVFSPEAVDVEELGAGEVGFLCGSIKELGDAAVGDTITLANRPADEPVPGFKKAQPMVFCGLYPTESGDYENLKAALEKLQLNDAAFTFEPETSQALGFGFRCGFLGLLHMEIIQERLEREFRVGLIATAPSVIYRVETTDGKTAEIDNPSLLPDQAKIRALYEPYVDLDIHVPSQYLGNVMKLCEERRATQKNLRYLSNNRVVATYEIPFAEIVYDFFDRLKSVSRGYASMDYQPCGYKQADLVRLDIMLGTSRCACGNCPQGQGLSIRALPGAQAQAHHSAPAFHGCHPGGHWPENNRQGNCFRLPQGCNRKMLWRRHHPQAQVAGKTERRQKAHETNGQRGIAPGGFSGRAQGWR